MSRRSKAILLALFFGGFGIHKFYLNKPLHGILYLLFFWTYIPTIIALVEVLYYLTMSDKKFDKNIMAKVCKKCAKGGEKVYTKITRRSLSLIVHTCPKCSKRVMVNRKT